MPGTFFGKLLFTGIVGTLAIAAPFHANEARANSSDNADPTGTIIISRNVDFRSAIDPGIPGQAHRVDVSPNEIITGALGSGLKPLSDREAANMAAPIGAKMSRP